MTSESRRQKLEARFIACRTDAAALRAIEEELHRLAEPWAGSMRLRVIHARLCLKTNGTVMKIPEWCTRFGLPAPDGRPLYRYRVDQGCFVKLETYLTQQARSRRLGAPGDPALFALWAAEWFRRDHQGGARKWDALGARLGLSLSQAEYRVLADAGLRAWHLKPLRLHGATHRLLNLSRQGGFPLAAVEGEANLWAAHYLTRLVGVLLGQPGITAEQAFGQAQALVNLVKPTWQHDDFYVVSADLALTVIKLRQEAREAGAPAGLPVSVWLDRQRPQWRDDLPLTINSDAGRTLIDGMLRAEVVRGDNVTICAARLLRPSGGIWHPWLRLDLAGSLTIADGARLASTWSRLRLFANGILARHLPDELAVMEPLGEDRWSAQPRRAVTKAPVPLDVPAMVELRGGGDRVGNAVLLSRGAALRSPLLVCRTAEDAAAEADDPPLEVLGSSSGAYRADPLFVAMPADWRVQTEDAAAPPCGRIGATSDGRAIWRVQGAVQAIGPDGDHYRLLAGQDSEIRDTLHLAGPIARGLASRDGQTVYLGAPRAEVRDRGLPRAPKPGELWWRPAGERTWRPTHSGVAAALGAIDLAWRTASGLVRDRQSVVILPQDFAVTVSAPHGHADITVKAWPGTMDVEGGRLLDGMTWRIEGAAAQAAAITMVLRAPGLSPVRLEKRLHQMAHLRDWRSGRLPANRCIALADLHRYVAWCDGHARLLAQLRNGSNHRVEAAELRWSFEDELPLNIIRDDLASLLRPLGDLDARIELSFEGAQGSWYVVEFAPDPNAVPADELAHWAGRPLHDPTLERDFGALDPTSSAPFALPDAEGVWLTYLRRGERVLTRPRLISGAPLPSPSASPLARAMAIANHAARQSALAEVCDAAVRNDAAGRALRREIAVLAATLRGLPPATFDVLALLSAHPLLAVRLLFAAGEDDLPALLDLESGLPLAWCLIPCRHWDEAANLEFDALESALRGHVADAVSPAGQAVASGRARIAASAPLLRPLLNLPAPKVTLKDAMQNFLHSEHDRTDYFASDLFRHSLNEKLPKLAFDEAYWRALDAPCAAALAAREEAALDDAQRRGVKDIARRFPRYFQDAFSAMLRSPARA